MFLSNVIYNGSNPENYSPFVDDLDKYCKKFAPNHARISSEFIAKHIQQTTRLVSLSKDHKKIILYAAPGKEPFYRKLGFKRMATAMAIFKNQAQALEDGLLIDEL